MKAESNEQLLPSDFQIIGHLLEMASDSFSNHGCNDVPDEVFEGVSREYRVELARKMQIANGSPEEHEEDSIWETNSDWWLMSYFAKRCKTLASQPDTRTPSWTAIEDGGLPKDENFYVVTYIQRDKRYVGYAQFDCELAKWFTEDRIGLVNVIAWMPLPEPYRAQGGG